VSSTVQSNFYAIAEEDYVSVFYCQYFISDVYFAKSTVKFLHANCLEWSPVVATI
jgi:hypothetical protein